LSTGHSDGEYAAYRVIDVLNYGGFFGGETVTLDARPLANPDRIFSYIIPEHLFDNLTQRHLIQPGIALGLVVDGGEVRAARVLGAPTREQLKELVKPPTPEGDGPGPRALSYRCASCDLWIGGTPDRQEDGYYCRLCGTKLG
jgi:DNA-directed RNA polymerase subunit RPC12/RpoP